MSLVWDAVMFCLPAALFLPVFYLLLRDFLKPAADEIGTTHPKSASLLMSGVLVSLFIAWGWVGYNHFFR